MRFAVCEYPHFTMKSLILNRKINVDFKLQIKNLVFDIIDAEFNLVVIKDRNEKATRCFFSFHFGSYEANLRAILPFNLKSKIVTSNLWWCI